jgi:hypothetical protein
VRYERSPVRVAAQRARIANDKQGAARPRQAYVDTPLVRHEADAASCTTAQRAASTAHVRSKQHDSGKTMEPRATLVQPWRSDSGTYVQLSTRSSEFTRPQGSCASQEPPAAGHPFAPNTGKDANVLLPALEAVNGVYIDLPCCFLRQKGSE